MKTELSPPSYHSRVGISFCNETIYYLINTTNKNEKKVKSIPICLYIYLNPFRTKLARSILSAFYPLAACLLSQAGQR